MNDTNDKASGRGGLLPDHDPPLVGPTWRPLMEAPCKRCGRTRLYMEGGKPAYPVPIRGARTIPGEPPDPEMAESRLVATVLCGDCGLVDDRPGWIATKEAEQALHEEGNWPPDPLQ